VINYIIIKKWAIRLGQKVAAALIVGLREKVWERKVTAGTRISSIKTYVRKKG